MSPRPPTTVAVPSVATLISVRLPPEASFTMPQSWPPASALSPLHPVIVSPAIVIGVLESVVALPGSIVRSWLSCGAHE